MKTPSQPQSVNAPSVCYQLARRMKHHTNKTVNSLLNQKYMQTNARARGSKQEQTEEKKSKQTTATDSKTNAKNPAFNKTKTNVSK